MSPDIVISQVYGGGGNSGAPYNKDFIELYNRGSATVDLTGWSLQYASATGTGNFGSSATQLTLLSGSVAPGQRWLVQESGGATGANLPTPDLIDADPINMSGSAGKVALVHDTASLGCNGGSTPCPPAKLALIVDLIGWGNANFFEGSGAAPGTSNSTAAVRIADGCGDTDNNATDFVAIAPNPRNSSSPTSACTLSGSGAATPSVVLPGETSLLTSDRLGVRHAAQHRHRRQRRPERDRRFGHPGLRRRRHLGRRHCG